MRATAGLVAASLGAGCLSIDDQEDAARQRVASLLGPYAGTWEMTLELGARTDAECSGETSGTATGQTFGDPLDLDAAFSCTTDGLVSAGSQHELSFEATLNATLAVEEGQAGALSGELELRYEDTSGTPDWQAEVDEAGLPLITGEFDGSVSVPLLGDVDFAGTFSLTHAATD